LGELSRPCSANQVNTPVFQEHRIRNKYWQANYPSPNRCHMAPKLWSNLPANYKIHKFVYLFVYKL